MKQSLKTQDGTRPIQQSLWAGSRKGLVSRIPLPGSEKAKMMTVTSGRRCLESFEKFNRPGLLAKTFPALLIGQKGWYSKKCNLTWKLKATRSNRLYFQLQASVPRTEEIGCGLLPTPTAMAEAEGKMKSTQQKEGSRHSLGLGSAMAMGLLPTPQAIDGCGGGRDLRQKKDSKRDLSKPGSWRGDLKDVAQLLPTPTSVQRDHPERVAKLKATGAKTMTSRKAGENRPNSILDAAMFYGMLPTPATRDYKGARSQEALEASGRNQTNSLPDAFAQTGKTSQLNHQFVMEMMGFPPDWCDIYYEMAEIAIQKKRQRKKPKG